jgi:hypothetical protein
VATNGVKTHDFTFRIKGAQVRRISLGEFPDKGLEATCDRANELRRAARSGRDFIEEEKRAAAESARRVTIAGLIEDYAKRELRGRLKTGRDRKPSEASARVEARYARGRTQAARRARTL